MRYRTPAAFLYVRVVENSGNILSNNWFPLDGFSRNFVFEFLSKNWFPLDRFSRNFVFEFCLITGSHLTDFHEISYLSLSKNWFLLDRFSRNFVFQFV